MASFKVRRNDNWSIELIIPYDLSVFVVIGSPALPLVLRERASRHRIRVSRKSSRSPHWSALSGSHHENRDTRPRALVSFYNDLIYISYARHVTSLRNPTTFLRQPIIKYYSNVFATPLISRSAAISECLAS